MGKKITIVDVLLLLVNQMPIIKNTINLNPKNTPTVTCVVVTYNRCKCLLKCLDGLINQSFPVNKIILVDNGSNDSTRQEIEKLKIFSEKIIYFNTGGNHGSSGGFNIGFKIALEYKSDWVWVMDDDVIPESNCLAELIASSSDHQVVQPYRYYGAYEYVKSECRKLNFVNPFREQKIDYISTPEKTGNSEIACFPFEGPLIKFELFSRNDPPNEKYFIIGDDTEYSIRLARDGGRFKMCSTALMERQIRPKGVMKLNWKSYFTIRNNIFNDAKNSGSIFTVVRALSSASKMILGGIFRRRTLDEYGLIVKSTVDGIFGIYRKPEEIIRQYQG